MTTQTAIYQPPAPPAGLSVTAQGSGGTFAAATYFWKVTFVTAYDNQAESVASSEATVAVALNGTATLTLPAIPPGTKMVNVYRGTATNAENRLVGTVAPVAGIFPPAFVDTGGAGSAATPPAVGTLTTVTKKAGLVSVDKTSAVIAALSVAQQQVAQQCINEWLQCAGGGIGNGTGTQALRVQKRLASIGLRLQEV